jgi:hypothetical protein
MQNLSPLSIVVHGESSVSVESMDLLLTEQDTFFAALGRVGHWREPVEQMSHASKVKQQRS